MLLLIFLTGTSGTLCIQSCWRRTPRISAWLTQCTTVTPARRERRAGELTYSHFSVQTKRVTLCVCIFFAVKIYCCLGANWRVRRADSHLYPPGAAGFASDATHSLPPTLRRQGPRVLCLPRVRLQSARTRAKLAAWIMERRELKYCRFHQSGVLCVAKRCAPTRARLLAFLFCTPLFIKFEKMCMDVFCCQIMK